MIWRFGYVFVFLSSSFVMSAENYIGAHISDHPQLVACFIHNLPQEDALSWQAWCHLQTNDYDQANACFYRLAVLGCPQGYRGLADSYLAGQGFSKNVDLALVLYEKAAALGSGPAQVNAAVLRADRGEWNQARIWFKLALSNLETASMHEELERLYHKRMDGHL